MLDGEKNFTKKIKCNCLSEKFRNGQFRFKNCKTINIHNFSVAYCLNLAMIIIFKGG